MSNPSSSELVETTPPKSPRQKAVWIGVEVVEKYAPLRYYVLHLELGWGQSNPKTPTDLVDGYDSYSLPYGVFHDEDLAGAFRIVIGQGADSLPSGQAIRRFAPPVGTCEEPRDLRLPSEFCTPVFPCPVQDVCGVQLVEVCAAGTPVVGLRAHARNPKERRVKCRASVHA